MFQWPKSFSEKKPAEKYTMRIVTVTSNVIWFLYICFRQCYCQLKTGRLAWRYSCCQVTLRWRVMILRLHLSVHGNQTFRFQQLLPKSQKCGGCFDCWRSFVLFTIIKSSRNTGRKSVYRRHGLNFHCIDARPTVIVRRMHRTDPACKCAL